MTRLTNHEALQIALAGIHRQAQREDARYRNEIRAALVAWERKDGPKKWLELAEFERTKRKDAA